MGVVRVLIADLPGLQSDVLARLVEAEPDLVVVGSGQSLERFAEIEADVLLLSPRQLTPALSGSRRAGIGNVAPIEVGVLAVDATEGTIVRVVVVPDEDDWPRTVVAAIRSVAPYRTARHRRDLGPPVSPDRATRSEP